jgi:hypothetical protein
MAMWVTVLYWAVGFAVFVGVLLFAASSKTSGRGPRGRVGNALQPLRGIDFGHLLNLQSVYEPGKRHLLEQQQEEGREEDDEGDPPTTG